MLAAGHDRYDRVPNHIRDRKIKSQQLLYCRALIFSIPPSNFPHMPKQGPVIAGTETVLDDVLSLSPFHLVCRERFTL
jgi:hypothetical protein